MKEQTEVIVLGGGIIGIYSALYCQKIGKQVTLIEGSSELGGLLKSFSLNDKLHFDMGTHFINKTTIKEVDDILLNDKILSSLDFIEEQKTSSITNSKLHNGSPFANLTFLKEDLHHKIKQEFKEYIGKRPIRNSDYYNLDDEFEDMFGQTANSELLTPLYKKRFGVDHLKDLAPAVSVIFGHRRVIAFNPQETKDLKSSTILDHRISHHGTESYSKKSEFYYPKSGGIQGWIKKLEESFLQNGGKILKDTFVTSISQKGSKKYICQLSNDERVTVDHIISTIPPFLLAKSLNFQFKSESSPPKWTSTSIVNLEIDQNYLSDSHYIVNHDPKIDFFRATLYENFNPGNHSSHRITIEVISPRAKEQQVIIEKTLTELKKSMIIPENSKVLSSKVISLDRGFPIFTSKMINTSKDLCKSIEDEYPNILILGRHNSGKWLMTENLSIASKRLKSLSDD